MHVRFPKSPIHCSSTLAGVSFNSLARLIEQNKQGYARLGSSRENVVGSGTGRDENGNPECISFPTATSRPLPDLGLCSVVYRPDLRHFVPVPTVSSLAARFISNFSRPAVRPVVPISSRRSHTVFPIPQLTTCTIVADVPIPSSV